MSQAGYTLSEVLVAMAVIGMAACGLSLGMRVIGTQQWRTGQTVAQIESLRGASLASERLLALGAPFHSREPDRFEGGSDAFRFACSAPEPCRVSLVETAGDREMRVFRGKGEPAVFKLAAKEPLRFSYLGAAAATARWPPGDSASQTLRAVSLMEGDASKATTLAEMRVWLEQSEDCAFDPVSRDCR